MKTLIEDRFFINENFSNHRLTLAEYDNCTFNQCDFSNSNLSALVFTECEFIDCNLSNANIKNATFNEVMFTDCKLLGVAFKELSTFLLSLKFTSCNLQMASFDFLKLKETVFTKCNLQQAVFYETDLNKAVFDECDLQQAQFINANLQQADFSSALNFSINPNNNQLKGAKFSKDNLHGLLDSFQINIV